MSGQPITIGPFIGGLNNFSDPTSVADNELVVCENFELDLDGSLKSRPPYIDTGFPLTLGNSGDINLLGYFSPRAGVQYLIASDGASSTYYFDTTTNTWHTITNTVSGVAMCQFDGCAWITADPNSSQTGGLWTPTAHGNYAAGWTDQPNMPKGNAIVANKFRLWVAAGKNATTNPTRLYYSNVLGSSTFWPSSPNFIDIGAGDGQAIVQILPYYGTMLIFRTDSTWSFTYSSDPGQGVIQTVLPTIGLENSDCLVAYDAYLYFIYGNRVYEFINNRAQQINQKVILKSSSQVNVSQPYSVSIFNKRVIVSVYDTQYVFSLLTRTWTTWKTTRFKSIGQLFQLPGEPDSDITAYCASSQSVPSPTTTRNLVTNPRAISSGTAWRNYASTATIDYMTNGPYNTAAGMPTYLTTAARFTYSTTQTSRSVAGGAGLVPCTPGQAYTASVWAGWGTGGPTNPQNGLCAYLWWADASGNFISSTIGTPGYPVSSNDDHKMIHLSVTAVAPAGATQVGVGWHQDPNGALIQAGATVYCTGAVLVAGANVTEPDGSILKFFDGSTPSDSGFTYAWTGTANASVSTKTSIRQAALLSITDAFLADNAENMTCTLTTKNLNYGTSSAFKRLFWWGIDVIFRGSVEVIVQPIVKTFSVTWGQLLSGGITWGSEYQGSYTWGQPLTNSFVSDEIVDQAGTAAIRKFVKLLKSMRFRQINFSMTFTTDGSSSTAPVRLFSLMTYVGIKESVVDKVS